MGQHAHPRRRSGPSIGPTRRHLTHAQVATLLEFDQPTISVFTRGPLAGFSLDRLVRFLVLLGNDVEMVVKAHRKSSRQARLMIA